MVPLPKPSNRTGRGWPASTVALLIAACALLGRPAPKPAPRLHPHLSDAMSEGFHLLVGRAPFTVQFSLENAEGYRQRWDVAGGVAAQPQNPLLVRFDRPGVYFPSVTLSAWGRPTVRLKQKIVVLSDVPAQSPPGKYGVNQDLAWDPREQVVPEIELMKAVGVQWVRLPIRWQFVLPQEGIQTWEGVDAVIDDVLEAHLRILAVLDAAPRWANGAARDDAAGAYDLTRVNDFANYVYAVAQHYQGRIQAYEMLNEPNSPMHWGATPDAGRFIQFLCAGYYAAKYADPTNVIVVGGLNGNGLFLGWESPEARDFLKAIYAGPGAGCFDVMAIHPFAHPTENGLPGLQQWVDQALAYMRAQRDARELWLTEAGWSTGPHQWGHTTITEQQQAAWVEAVYRDLTGPQKVFWYNFKEVRAHPAQAEFQWGWLRFDLEPKPAYESFEALEK